MPKQRTPLDYDRYRELQSQGLSRRQIAKALGIPESTLRDNLKVLQKGQQSPPEVDLGTQQSQEQQEGITVAAQTLSHAVENPPKDHQGTPALGCRTSLSCISKGFGGFCSRLVRLRTGKLSSAFRLHGFADIF